MPGQEFFIPPESGVQNMRDVPFFGGTMPSLFWDANNMEEFGEFWCFS